MLSVRIRRCANMEKQSEKVDMGMEALKAVKDELVAAGTRDKIVKFSVALGELAIGCA